MQKSDELSDEELVFLVQQNNKEALIILIERYRKKSEIICKKIIREFPNTGIPLQDLIAVGLTTLISSIKTFKFYDEKKTSFSSYWNVSITRNIMDYLQKYSYKSKGQIISGISLDNVLKKGDDETTFESMVGEPDIDVNERFLFQDFERLILVDEHTFSGNEKDVALSWLYDDDIDRISKQFNIKKSKVYYVINKAKELLKNHYTNISK